MVTALLDQTQILKDLPMNVAEAIEYVTSLSHHPAFIAGQLGKMADLIGAAINAMLARGTPIPLIADTVAKNPTALDAANEWLASIGKGTVADYQSKVNSEITDAQIRARFDQLVSTATSEQDARASVVQAAINNGVGSAQLAAAIGKTQEWVLEQARLAGMPAFASGTDRVTRDQFARIHQDEIIFDAPRSAQLRDAIVRNVTEGGLSGPAIQKLIAALDAQTQLLAGFMAQAQQLTASQREAFQEASAGVRDSIDRLRREIEDRAA